MALVSDYPIVRFHQTGGPEVLQLERASLAEPQGGEVAIKVLAIGMTQGDAMYRSGTYLEKPNFPSGLGTEVCGEVIATGPDASRYAIGDRVSSLSSMSLNKYPLYGDYALVPETSLIRTPSAMSDEEGAAFTLAYIPMYLALFREAGLKAGDWLVLNAAAATTSIAACQMAKLGGAQVIGLVRSAAKKQALQENPLCPYDAVLDMSSEDFVAEVLALTNGGADIVLDPAGGEIARQLGNMCGWRGRIVHYGALAGPDVTYSIYDLASKFLSISGFTIYGYTGSEVMGLERYERAIAEAERFLEFGFEKAALRPVISERFALTDIVDAHRALARSAQIGKLIVFPTHTQRSAE